MTKWNCTDLTYLQLLKSDKKEIVIFVIAEQQIGF